MRRARWTFLKLERRTHTYVHRRRAFITHGLSTRYVGERLSGHLSWATLSLIIICGLYHIRVRHFFQSQETMSTFLSRGSHAPTNQPTSQLVVCRHTFGIYRVQYSFYGNVGKTKCNVFYFQQKIRITMQDHKTAMCRHYLRSLVG